MTDKELLELAAKAADMDVEYMEGFGFLHCFNEYDKVWNPLTDDGDALRLAVKLHMKVYVGEVYPWDSKIADYSHKYQGICDETEEPDPYAATRRAIVRAAAEIGRTL